MISPEEDTEEAQLSQFIAAKKNLYLKIALMEKTFNSISECLEFIWVTLEAGI